MEMHELDDTEGKRNDETRGPSASMLEANKEKQAETDPYSKLQSPPEDVYSEAFYGDDPMKTKAGSSSPATGKQTAGNIRLYRGGCIFLTILSLLLLLIVIILSTKLQTGSTVCPEREEITVAGRRSPSFAPTCSYDQCQAHITSIQLQHLGCRQCADGWLTFGRSCFFLSTFRLTWDESQRNCSARGGSLAVVTSQGIQRFLTKKGKMMYWIGLRHRGETWSWVNNTALQDSYWAEGGSNGDCGILNSEKPPEKNWVTARCGTATYFICHLHPTV